MRSKLPALRRRIEKLERQRASESRGDLERRIEAQLEAMPLGALASGDLPPALRSDLRELHAMISPAEFAGMALSASDASLAAVAFGGVP